MPSGSARMQFHPDFGALLTRFGSSTEGLSGSARMQFHPRGPIGSSTQGPSGRARMQFRPQF
eukprot:2543718-Pyramimonas_sp.AAC.1